MYMKVRRAAKISTAQYENTDVSVELEDHIRDNETVIEAFKRLCAEADTCLRIKIDDITEVSMAGKHKMRSKAYLYGC